ncbi:helix-turn-helix domain-containing protein [Aminobacter sp. MET-1]|uniref:helix-turn-helix domain-containing protein n=1 Tax=Aminobacter sp. MET-1 TaxID=2951085 RepID=UPI00226A311D|nr:helix-turn-helix transcriptional regulator [Aminobacter sp. MET-1]MCX8568791.1 helix-turn-helix transcriptional regulator [Aminobacter sp. MET-1]
MEPFATNLRKRAEELGISNAEAARRAGLSERRYGNYVSGRREPDLATLVRIADVLATTPNHLLTLTLGELDKRGATTFKDRIAAAAVSLPVEDLERISIMVEALAAARNRD